MNPIDQHKLVFILRDSLLRLSFIGKLSDPLQFSKVRFLQTMTFHLTWLDTRFLNCWKSNLNLRPIMLSSSLVEVSSIFIYILLPPRHSYRHYKPQAALDHTGRDQVSGHQLKGKHKETLQVNLRSIDFFQVVQGEPRLGGRLDQSYKRKERAHCWIRGGLIGHSKVSRT
jgi:hypothetical protein